MNRNSLIMVAAAAAALALVYLLQPVLGPFLVGALIAYLGDPLVDRLERKGMSRTAGVCVVFALVLCLLVLAVVLLVPMLVEQMVTLGHMLPQALDKLRVHLLPWLAHKLHWQQPEALLDQVRGALAGHWGSVTGVAGDVVQRVTASGLALLAFLGNLALVPVVAFYLLRDWDILMNHLRDLLPRHWQGRTVGLLRECDEVLSAFLRGQLAVMLALGAIYAVGLQLVGLELGLLLGAIAGLASVVPYLGFVVGIVSSGLAAAFQFQEWTPLLWVLLVFGVGQFLEGMVLTPRLVGDRIGLHPVAVIFAVLAGGQLFGFVGILLSLPVAAVIMVFLRHMHHSYKRSAFYGPEPEPEPAEAGQPAQRE